MNDSICKKKYVEVAKCPTHWKFRMELGSDLLKTFNPVPMLLNCTIEIQGLHAHRESLYLIFAELYSNALEHGVLGMKSDTKHNSEEFSNYYVERENRLSKLGEGYINIDLQHVVKDKHGILSIYVEDSGSGFDMSLTNKKLESNIGHEGRGIPLLHNLCRRVEYVEKGNKVRAIFSWNINE